MNLNLVAYQTQAKTVDSIQMKLFLIILALQSQLLASASITTFLSHSICKVIEHFYIKFTNNIDIIDFDGTQGELITEVVQNIQDSITVQLFKVENQYKWTQKLQRQSILFFKNFNSLKYFNGRDLVQIDYMYPL